MPTVPKSTKCNELGCTASKVNGSAFCSKHGGERSDKRKANTKLYGSGDWQKVRARQLSATPLCQRCMLDNKVRAAEHIDHVFPHRQDKAKFRLNLYQSLCHACHTLKGKQERRGIYEHYTAHGLVTYTDADYTRLMDSQVLGQHSEQSEQGNR